ncbi:SRPBCC family protein [Mycobacterium sp. DL592]|uniref:SRPBCC family protein n=1 Tax=Mycobacterium sp. DL592 TaxID=2675524 RepID=UPI00141D7C4E|nr:SRPBCC family protein [Mycobacterium sp. DL592]
MTTLDITRTIDINAPVEKVWRALTQPELIAEWFGDTAEFVAEEGSSGAFGWEGHGSFRVTVEHVEEPKTLVYRWARDRDADPVPGNSTLVRFDLTPTAAGTRLTLVETGFEELDDPRGHHDGNSEGWTAELADLAAYVTRR